MSKPCQGIALTPVKGSSLLSTTPAAAVPVGRYLPPSARPKKGIEPATLTADEINSDKLFPTLGNSISRGASWPQIRERLAQPAQTLSEKVKEGIERAEKEAEEGYRREQETNPWKMDEDQLERNGWVKLKLGKKYFEDWVQPPPEPLEFDEWIMTLPKDEAPKRVVDSFAEVAAAPPPKIYYSESSEDRAKRRIWAFMGRKL
jgi:hypothetical protein